MADMQTRGLSEMLEQLKQLPAEFASKNGGPLRAALAKAAAVGRDAAKAKAPVDTGALRDNIVIYRDKKPGAGGHTERYEVGVRHQTAKKIVTRSYGNTRANRRKGRVGDKFQARGALFYAMILEFGAPARGIAPRGYLRKAKDETDKQADLVFRQTLQKAMDRITRKIAKKRAAQ